MASSKHHYIPKFYLENFTNAEGKFYIYLVKEDRFKKNGELFSPKSHFFEEGGNTIFWEDTANDHLELAYAELDSRVANIFNQIKYSNDPGYGLSSKDMPLLQFFVAHLFWRNPVNDEFSQFLLKEIGLGSTGMTLKNLKTNEVIEDSEFEKKLVENESAYKMVKHWIPYEMYPTLLQNTTPLNLTRFDVGEKPTLLSDNPLIVKSPAIFDIYRDDFILPVTKDIYFSRMNTGEMYQNDACIYIDALLLKQANKFVATTNMNYINLLKNSREYSLSKEELVDIIFTKLS